MNTTVPPHDIHRLLHAEHDDPFGVLGLHQIDQVWVVRSLRPDAKELAIVDRHNVERRFPATRIAEEGLYEAQLEGVSECSVARYSRKFSHIDYDGSFGSESGISPVLRIC